jgi:hypothetical protein
MSIPSGSMRSSGAGYVARAGRAIWLSLLLPCLAFAHGLLLDAKHVGDRIEGTVYYTNGELAVREAVELLDLSSPGSAVVAGETDDSGKFNFPVTAGHRYRISAYAAEGHGVDIEIDAVANAKPRLIEDETAEESDGLPPAWAVIGVLLLASIVPVVISRRRRVAGSNASR